jgi:hypothetical protein
MHPTNHQSIHPSTHPCVHLWSSVDSFTGLTGMPSEGSGKGRLQSAARYRDCSVAFRHLNLWQDY